MRVEKCDCVWLPNEAFFHQRVGIQSVWLQRSYEYNQTSLTFIMVFTLLASCTKGYLYFCCVSNVSSTRIMCNVLSCNLVHVEIFTDSLEMYMTFPKIFRKTGCVQNL